jgi:hypothetical protein
VLTLRFTGHISTDTAREAATWVATRLKVRGARLIVVDLLDVNGFDPIAPVTTVEVLAGLAGYIGRVDVIVRSAFVRAAAISALHLLGVSHSVRSSREPAAWAFIDEATPA